VVCKGQHLAMHGFDEGLVHRVVQKPSQAIIVAGDVQEADGLPMEAQLAPGPDLEDLFQGAGAAGKRSSRSGPGASWASMGSPSAS